MEIKKIDGDFCICKVKDFSQINLDNEFIFVGKTDEEKCIMCCEKDVPANTISVDSGWKGFRIQGELDFSLVGILSKISTLLADSMIPIYAISTFNTDYIFVKKENFNKSIDILLKNNYAIIN